MAPPTEEHRCDICLKKDKWKGMKLRECLKCGVHVHEGCYGIDPNPRKSYWVCWPCKLKGKTIEGWSLSNKCHQDMIFTERPTECVLCSVNTGLHAMHPLYHYHGAEGRQVILPRYGKSIPERLGWVHSVCAFGVCCNRRTAGCVYGCDSEGNFDSDGYTSMFVLAGLNGDQPDEVEYMKILKTHRKLKCYICGRKDSTAGRNLRVPLQCCAGDKDEFEDFLQHHQDSVGSPCLQAMHVGCAQWGTKGVEPHKPRRMWFFPGGAEDDDSEDEVDPVTEVFCDHHALQLGASSTGLKRSAPEDIAGTTMLQIVPDEPKMPPKASKQKRSSQRGDDDDVARRPKKKLKTASTQKVAKKAAASTQEASKKKAAVAASKQETPKKKAATASKQASPKKKAAAASKRDEAGKKKASESSKAATESSTPKSPLPTKTSTARRSPRGVDAESSKPDSVAAAPITASSIPRRKKDAGSGKKTDTAPHRTSSLSSLVQKVSEEPKAPSKKKKAPKAARSRQAENHTASNLEKSRLDQESTEAASKSTSSTRKRRRDISEEKEDDSKSKRDCSDDTASGGGTGVGDGMGPSTNQAETTSVSEHSEDEAAWAAGEQDPGMWLPESAYGKVEGTEIDDEPPPDGEDPWAHMWLPGAPPFELQYIAKAERPMPDFNKR